MKRYFVTGIDTEIGKTYASCHLIKHWIALNKVVRVLKPVASGCLKVNDHLVSEDTLTYQTVLKKPSSVSEGWSFEQPISPHLAAELTGISLSASAIVDWCQLQWQGAYDITLIEGAGGLMVPLNMEETWLDVVKALNIPVILVVGIRLGCLNHALLTASVLASHNIPLHAWVANQIDSTCLYPERLIETLAFKLNAPCLMQLPFEPDWVV